MTKKEAIMLRSVIEAMAVSMSDDDILVYPRLAPNWQTGKDYVTGDRVRYNDKVYKCLQNHTSQADWTPVGAVSLWAEVINEGIPEWKQPESTNPYMKGDRVRYKGKIYESTMDNNVWSPEDYPAAWREVE